MTGENIVLVGGGGHCKSCIDVIETQGEYRIAGIVDTKEKVGTKVSGYEIFASDEDLPKLAKEYRYFLITVGRVGTTDKRRELFERVGKMNVRFPGIVSPNARISKHSEIGEGTIVMHGAFINAGVRIGKNCIVNTSAVIEHDSVIGDHCHISTGCVVNGECTIGTGVLIGSNSVVNQCLSICDGAVIGSGAVVIASIGVAGTYAGNPAVRIK